MAANIEKHFAYRVDPTMGDKIGTLRYVDPLTNDTIYGEQAASYGHPAKFVKIAAAANTINADYPPINTVTIAGGSLANNVVFSGAFPAGDATGHLVWYEESGTNANQVRKLVSVSSNTYDVNRDWPAAPTSGHSYRLLIDCFRYNAMLVKVEFSDASAVCDIRPSFFSVNQDNDNPTPGIAAPKRYMDRSYRVQGTSIQGDTEETNYYHGQVLSFGVHGALGAVINLEYVSAGEVSIWVALV